MKHARTLITVAISGLLVRAAEVDLSKLPPPSGKKNLTYAKDIKPIFEGTCFRCHGEEKQKGELRLDSLAAALKGGEDGKVIIPGQSSKSPLVIAVARLDDETAMPPKMKPRGPGGPGGPGQQGGPGPRKQGENPKNPPPGAPPGGHPPSGSGGLGGPGGPGGFQPPKPLTSEQVSLIRAWIDQGAK